MVDSKKGVTKTPYKIVGDWRQGGTQNSRVELRTASWSVPIDTQGTARQEFCLDRNESEPCVQGYLKGTMVD